MPFLINAKKILFSLISINFFILVFFFFLFHRKTIPFFGFFSISPNTTNTLRSKTYSELKTTPTLPASKLTTLGSHNDELGEPNGKRFKKPCPMIPDNLGAYFKIKKKLTPVLTV